MKNFRIPLLFLLILWTSQIFAQTGITIGPPRVFFNVGPGQTQTEKVLVTNPSKDFKLELGISLEDWDYGTFGDNQLYSPGTLKNSAANWVFVPETFFSLAPGESKEIEIQMNVPADYVALDSVPVKTVMLFVSQLNPRDGVDEAGENIRIAVRTGIKLYQRNPGPEIRDIEINNFKYINEENQLELHLYLHNKSTIWTEAAINTELLNTETGKKYTLNGILSYLMPFDDRIERIALPADLPSGSYIATTLVDYGDTQKIRIAELEFKH